MKFRLKWILTTIMTSLLLMTYLHLEKYRDYFETKLKKYQQIKENLNPSQINDDNLMQIGEIEPQKDWVKLEKAEVAQKWTQVEYEGALVGRETAGSRLEQVEIAMENADVEKEAPEAESKSANLGTNRPQGKLVSLADIEAKSAETKLKNVKVELEKAEVKLENAKFESQNAEIHLKNTNTSTSHEEKLGNVEINLQDAETEQKNTKVSKSTDLAEQKTVLQDLDEKSPTLKTESTTEPAGKKEYCKEFPSELRGNLWVNPNISYSLEEALSAAGGKVQEGCFEPRDCIARQTVAIVIPYKDRYEHLLTLLHHLHPILQRQKMKYCVFVAEQYDNGMFNKARVMNAAFVDITKRIGEYMTFDCFIFHDVDMLLENDNNLYKCGNVPKHMSTAIDKFDYEPNFGTKFGGVTAIRGEHYRYVNGHSNQYWGWGGEDNNMEKRIMARNLTIFSVHKAIGRYKMIRHEHPWWFHPKTGFGSHWTITKDRQTSLLLVRFYQARMIIVKHLIQGCNNEAWMGVESSTLRSCRRKNDAPNCYRDYELEKVIVRIEEQGGMTESIEVKKPRLEVKQGEKNDSQYPIGDATCNPTYLQLDHMTINRTRGQKQAYRKVYTVLNEAKDECTRMGTKCSAIVEREENVFTLRSTALVQENTLIYNFGKLQQYYVNETHKSKSVYVKICPGNTAYTQFFPKPFLIRGNEKNGVLPRFQTELVLKVYNKQNTAFTYTYKFSTTHKAVMEQKLQNNVISNRWWDSMSNVQQGGRILASKSSEDDGHVQTIRIKTPTHTMVRQPGCYLATASLMDNSTKRTILEWKWWFQVRAETEELEKAFTQLALEQSKKTGDTYRRMVEAEARERERQAEEMLKSYKPP